MMNGFYFMQWLEFFKRFVFSITLMKLLLLVLVTCEASVRLSNIAPRSKLHYLSEENETCQNGDSFKVNKEMLTCNSTCPYDTYSPISRANAYFGYENQSEFAELLNCTLDKKGRLDSDNCNETSVHLRTGKIFNKTPFTLSLMLKVANRKNNGTLFRIELPGSTFTLSLLANQVVLQNASHTIDKKIKIKVWNLIVIRHLNQQVLLIVDKMSSKDNSLTFQIPNGNISFYFDFEGDLNVEMKKFAVYRGALNDRQIRALSNGSLQELPRSECLCPPEFPISSRAPKSSGGRNSWLSNRRRLSSANRCYKIDTKDRPARGNNRMRVRINNEDRGPFALRDGSNVTFWVSRKTRELASPLYAKFEFPEKEIREVYKVRLNYFSFPCNTLEIKLFQDRQTPSLVHVMSTNCSEEQTDVGCSVFPDRPNAFLPRRGRKEGKQRPKYFAVTVDLEHYARRKQATDDDQHGYTYYLRADTLQIMFKPKKDEQRFVVNEIEIQAKKPDCSACHKLNAHNCSLADMVCYCKKGSTGSLCDKCSDGFFTKDDKCTPCGCQWENTKSCSIENGFCHCKAKFHGKQCEKVDSSRTLILVIIIIIVVFAGIIFLIVGFVCWKRSHAKETGILPLIISDLEIKEQKELKACLLDSKRVTWKTSVMAKGNYGNIHRGTADLEHSDTYFSMGPRLFGQFDIVVKRLHDHYLCLNERKHVTEFMREALIMRKISNDHVMPLYGVVDDPTSVCLVMPYMANEDLKSYLKLNQKLQIRDLVDLGKQVADGLTALHDAEVIHRDLACRNCLVDENLQVKIADFGLARDTGEYDYVASGQNVIAWRWAAPEVLEEMKFSTKSDVYSFGIVLWEILSRGEDPYPTFKDKEKLRLYLYADKMIQCPPDTPDRVQKVMERCLNLNCEWRPPIANVFKELKFITGQLNQYPRNDNTTNSDDVPLISMEVGPDYNQFDQKGQYLTPSGSQSDLMDMPANGRATEKAQYLEPAMRRHQEFENPEYMQHNIPPCTPVNGTDNDEYLIPDGSLTPAKNQNLKLDNEIDLNGVYLSPHENAEQRESLPKMEDDSPQDCSVTRL